MATPQITLRVETSKRDRWKAAALKRGTNVSAVLRTLMDEWVDEVVGPETETP